MKPENEKTVAELETAPVVTEAAEDAALDEWEAEASPAAEMIDPAARKKKIRQISGRGSSLQKFSMLLGSTRFN